MNTRKEPFTDPRVYKALRLLLDHQEAITGWAEVWFGGGELVSHLPGALRAWDFSEEELRKFLEWKQPKDDAVREALRLLSAAGFTRENPLRFVEDSSDSDYTQASAQLAQAQWRRLSQGVVQPELRVFENIAQINRMARGEFEVAGPSVRGGYIDPDPVFQQISRTNGANNFGKWSDPKADELIDKQRTLFDVRERKAVVRELLLYLIEHAPYAAFAARRGPWAAKPKVKNWAAGQLREPWYQYEHVWLDA